MTLSKKLTLTQLSALIDRSYEEHVRLECVNRLADFKYKQGQIFEILERCLQKDRSSLVKIPALRLMVKKYPEKSWGVIKWLTNHENSMPVLVEILTITINKEFGLTDKYDDIMQLLLKRVARTHDVCLEEAQFFLDLLFLLNKNAPRLHWAEMVFWYLSEGKGQSISWVKNPESSLIYAVKNGHIIALSFPFFELGELPESIGLLSELKYLNLCGNKLESLPSSFKSLSNLKELILYGKNLENDLDIIYNFAKQHYSDRYEKEGVISSEAPVLGLLEIFKGTPLEKIEIEIDLTDMECLHFYSLNENGHVIGIYIDDLGVKGVIPKQICKLKFLEDLRLAFGSASQIPDEIKFLTSLRVLDLMANRIKEIPKSINKLTNLEYLNLSHCCISEIPENLELPSSLKKLDLKGNNIIEIPKSISTLID